VLERAVRQQHRRAGGAVDRALGLRVEAAAGRARERQMLEMARGTTLAAQYAAAAACSRTTGRLLKQYYIISHMEK
jgi:hypothetical protein